MLTSHCKTTAGENVQQELFHSHHYWPENVWIRPTDRSDTSNSKNPNPVWNLRLKNAGGLILENVFFRLRL